MSAPTFTLKEEVSASTEAAFCSLCPFEVKLKNKEITKMTTYFREFDFIG
jgi:hypothetical protein